MPRVYHRFKPLREETPISFTEQEIQREKRDRMACNAHLADLMQAFGAERFSERELAKASAEYRSRCELDILPGSEFKPVTPRREEQSYCGSPAALSAGF